MRAQLRERVASADEQRDDDGERQCRNPEPAEDERRRVEIPHRDLDEHERAAPDQGEQHEHREVAAIHLKGSTDERRPM